MTVVKGTVDAAVVRGETDQQALTVRVARTVFGYLGSGPNTAVGMTCWKYLGE
ncbi:MAG: hypothetical protein WBQ75_20235 [Acetobacteraceae bacterium]